MDALTQLQKHKKAIRLINAILSLENRIDKNTRWKNINKVHYQQRIDIDTAIKTRLQNYYNKSFKL